MTQRLKALTISIIDEIFESYLTLENINEYYAFLFFLSEFCFTGTEDSRESRGRESTISIRLYFFHPPTIIRTFIL